MYRLHKDSPVAAGKAPGHRVCYKAARPTMTSRNWFDWATLICEGHARAGRGLLAGVCMAGRLQRRATGRALATTVYDGKRHIKAMPFRCCSCLLSSRRMKTAEELHVRFLSLFLPVCSRLARRVFVGFMAPQSTGPDSSRAITVPRDFSRRVSKWPQIDDLPPDILLA